MTQSQEQETKQAAILNSVKATHPPCLCRNRLSETAKVLLCCFHLWDCVRIPELRTQLQETGTVSMMSLYFIKNWRRKGVAKAEWSKIQTTLKTGKKTQEHVVTAWQIHDKPTGKETLTDELRRQQKNRHARRKYFQSKLENQSKLKAGVRRLHQ